MAAISALMQDT